MAVVFLSASAVACKPAARSSSGGTGGSAGGGGSGGSGGSNPSGGGGNGGGSGSGGNGASGASGSGGTSSGGSGGASDKGGAGGAGGGNGETSGGGNVGGGGGNGGGGGSNGGAGGNGGASGGGGTTVAKSSCGDGTLPADPKMPGYSAADHTKFQTQASTTVTNMSLADKAQQMRGTDPGSATARNWNDIFRQTDNTSKGIKGFLFRDGPRGVNLDAPIQASGIQHGKSTVFPVAAARGATWDVGLEYRIGQAMGDEMVAAGQTMLLAPTTNILRHPLWGRAQETYGEDSFLLGRLGSASVAGIQEYVAACAKHYAGNNVENGRATRQASMDEQTLREVYARHFEMIIKDGGVACIMAAYNLVNGSNCTQNTHLLNDVLRTDFGFNGFVLSDWWAMPGGSAGSPSATTGAGAIHAGLDMELPWNWHFSTLESGMVASSSGSSTVTQAEVDTSVKRILEQKYRFNADKGTGLQPSKSSLSNGSISSPHVDLALEAALKSMVLLKNDSNTLPISGSVKTIGVVGAKLDYFATIDNTTGKATSPGINNQADDFNNGTIDFAKGVRLGDVGSSRVDPDLTKSFSPAQGITAVAPSGVTIKTANTPTDATALGADFYVVVAGLTPYDEGEEYNLSGDRTTFALDGKDNGQEQCRLSECPHRCRRRTEEADGRGARRR